MPVACSIARHAAPPRSPLLVAAGLAVSHGADARTYNSSMCQRSSACGGLDIHYPLYLSNESSVMDGVSPTPTAATQAWPRADDSRDNATATLQLAGGTTYTVRGIDYDHHTITLADADALKE